MGEIETWLRSFRARSLRWKRTKRVSPVRQSCGWEASSVSPLVALVPRLPAGRSRGKRKDQPKVEGGCI